ncbi:hypothetical protein Q4Q35_15825 [Flavivirga aquimarina]|uniref:Tripartite tricarboxylate transporter TctB family protein n=1 Tax=Flavivirga aquimarina TaxID=2027862 RepID=A0ABT8WE43_9FLAO|nr:hypothetical protein [Flavivirga aquimarina]MDO5971277.1 hypothetical protein [Flavivirga aquimarina]
MESILNKKISIILVVFILASVFILWEHFNGGVITHHLLAREDLPGISNFWGLLSIPLLTWLIMSLINKRRDKIIKSEPTNLENYDSKILKGFLVALLFGIIASLLWEFNFSSSLQYFILAPIIIAFFKPVHLPEYLLGFVIGMLFTFGGILPIIIGIVLLVLCFLINKLTRILKNIFIKS